MALKWMKQIAHVVCLLLIYPLFLKDKTNLSLKFLSQIAYIDKLFHFFFFLFFAYSFMVFILPNGYNKSKKMILASMICFAYLLTSIISIELLQEYLTTTRTNEIGDVFAGLFGGLLGFIVFLKKRLPSN